MIYETVPDDTPIRQGDIFQNIPRLEIALSEILVVDNEETRVTNWKDIVEESGDEVVDAIISLRPVTGIVITQDCDTARGKDLCFALVDGFLDITGKNPKTHKSWWKLITNHTKSNLRYFYLPPCDCFGLENPMAADFRTILRVPLKDIRIQGANRVTRLNTVAYEHFRESLAQFYRRYPCNEWYPLSKEQAEDYAKSCPEPVQLYDWQK